MAKLIVTLADNSVTEIEITPRLEYAFELYAKKGFHKAFRDDEKQSDVYWLAWEGLRLSGVTVKPFGADFLETLKSVEVAESPFGLGRDSIHYLIARLSIETAIPPQSLIDLDSSMLQMLLKALKDRAKEQADAYRAKRR